MLAEEKRDMWKHVFSYAHFSGIKNIDIFKKLL